MSKYVIIDAEAIQKRIEELEQDYNEKVKVNDDQWCSIIAGQIIALKSILSQSTPLIPEIEKAFDAGSERCEFGYGNANDKQDYILNLKLDI